MGVLKDNYISFLEDLDKHVKDKEDLEYVKTRFAKFLDVILNQMDRIMQYKNEEIEELDRKQQELSDKMDKMEEFMNHVKEDIYADDDCDLEIICPYCNYDFFADVDESKTEVECPKCNNIIELDWYGDLDDDVQGCSGSCSSCHGCGDEDEEDFDDDDDDDDM